MIMPRFLAVDYFAEAQNETRAALNRMLISVPAHLDHVEGYLHNAVVPNASYRTPWQKSKAFVVDVQHDQLSAELSALANLPNKDKTEPFESDTILCNIKAGFHEIVPSSNPNSQNSLDDEVLQMLVDQMPDVDGTENFAKELNTSLVTGMCLEELTESSLTDQQNSLPSIHKLLTRLAPIPTTDPFTDKTGKPIDFKEVMRKDRELVLEGVTDGKLSNISTAQPEIFLNENIRDQSGDDFLTFGDNSSTVDIEPNPRFGSLHDVLKDVKEEQLDEEEPNYYVTALLEKCSVVKLGVQKFEVKDDGCKPKLLSFLDADTADDTSDADNGRELESPVCSDLSSLTIDKAMQQWKYAKPLPTETDSKIASDILSPISVKNVEMKMWLQEKYFDDVFALKLKEPSPSKNATNFELTAIEALRIAVIETNMFDVQGLDLELPWDPMQDVCYSLRRKPEPFEHFDAKASMVSLYDCDIAREPVESVELRFETVDESIPEAPRGKTVLSVLCHPKEQQIQTPHFMNKEKTAITSDTKLTIQGGNVDAESKEEDMNHAEPKMTLHTPCHKTPVKPKYSPISVCTPASFDDQLHFLSIRSSKLATKKRTATLPRSHVEMTKSKNKEPEKKQVAQSLSLEKRKVLNETIAKEEKSTPPAQSKRHPLKKSSIVTVQLDETHEQVLQILERLSSQYIQHLCKKRLLPASQDFGSLTSDVTRFILKQHEKIRQDFGGQAAASSEDMDYLSVVVLHTSVSCADIVAHCCLQSAIAHLGAMQEKFSSILKDSLNGLQKFMYKCYQGMKEKQHFHPAMVKMCESLSHWLVRKKLKSPGHDPKILIVTKHNVTNLWESIVEAVATVATADCIFPNHKQPTPKDICDKLDKHTCLVIPGTVISDSFPWSQFSMVVQYDYQGAHMQWKDICERQNIRFLGITVQPPTASYQKDMCSDHDVKKPQTILTGSEYLAQQTDLLQHLETNHNTLINVPGHTVSEYVPDVILDSKSCILMVSLSPDLQSDHIVDATMNRLTRLVLGYSMIWIFIHQAETSKRYIYSGDAVAIIVKIQAAVVSLGTIIKGAKTKVLVSGSPSSTATLIEQLGQSVANKKQGTPLRTQHELLLQRLPCLNPLSIQEILDKVPLQRLVQMSVQELVHYLPMIPLDQLQVLYNLFTLDQGLGPSINTRASPRTDYIRSDGPSHTSSREECMRGSNVVIPNPTETSKTVESYESGWKPQTESFYQTQDSEAYSIPDDISDLPHLPLSQPNEYEQAEMQGQLQTSFCQDPYDSERVKPQRFQSPTEHSAQYLQRDYHRRGQNIVSPQSYYVSVPKRNFDEQIRRSHKCKENSQTDSFDSLDVKQGQNIFDPFQQKTMISNSLMDVPFRYATTKSMSDHLPVRESLKGNRLQDNWSRDNMTYNRFDSKSPNTSIPRNVLCIAPVTPTVRRSLLVNNNDPVSPPMDLSSDDSGSNDNARALVEKNARLSSRASGSARGHGFHREIYAGYGSTSKGISLTPTKKRKLTYEKVPGRSGQTRLSFL